MRLIRQVRHVAIRFRKVKRNQNPDLLISGKAKKCVFSPKPKKTIHLGNCDNDPEGREELHELMHALGFLHEHQRNDDFKPVKVLLKNVKPNKRGQYEEKSNGKTLNTAYDVASIMHYHERVHAKPGKRTMVEYNGDRLPSFVGNLNILSATDKLALRIMYGKNSKRGVCHGVNARRRLQGGSCEQEPTCVVEQCPNFGDECKGETICLDNKCVSSGSCAEGTVCNAQEKKCVSPACTTANVEEKCGKSSPCTGEWTCENSGQFDASCVLETKTCPGGQVCSADGNTCVTPACTDGNVQQACGKSSPCTGEYTCSNSGQHNAACKFEPKSCSTGETCSPDGQACVPKPTPEPTSQPTRCQPIIVSGPLEYREPNFGSKPSCAARAVCSDDVFWCQRAAGACIPNWPILEGSFGYCIDLCLKDPPDCTADMEEFCNTFDGFTWPC